MGGADRHSHLIPGREFFDRPVREVARELLGMRLVRVLERGKRIEGRIVEVEAYDGPRDKACHASRGLTRRTEPMFGEPGHAYVYFIYGMHCCLNAVTGPHGYPAAVLLRAAEPIAGIEWMGTPRTKREGAGRCRKDRPTGAGRRVAGAADPADGASRLSFAAEGGIPARIARAGGASRGQGGTGGPSPRGIMRLASGPGRLARAFHVDLTLNRADLCVPGPLFIEAGEPVPARRIVRGPRIGVESAGSWALKPWRFGVRDHPALSRPFP